MVQRIDERKQKYQAEYKNLKFKSEKEFDVWLKKMTKYKIFFIDKGQDCLEWFLDEGGEVLHSNLQGFVWNGKLVDLFSLEAEKEIEIMDVKNQQNSVLDFIVKEIKVEK